MQVVPPDPPDLTDQWVMRGGQMSNEGDAAAIDELLLSELAQIAATDGRWRRLYRHRTTGRLWELSYPRSEMHGGGPGRLHELSLNSSKEWQ